MLASTPGRGCVSLELEQLCVEAALSTADTSSRQHLACKLKKVIIVHSETGSRLEKRNRARQLYKNISMLFLFPVKDRKLCTGVNATFDASCYG